MKHVSLDIETLGTRPGSIILSIGAVMFDPHTGKTGHKFYRNVIGKSCADAGLTSDPSTVQWWSEQSQEVRDALKVDRVPIAQALKELSPFVEGVEGVWGWGANFDVTLLECAYQAVGTQAPWKFWSVRCGRTVCAVADVAPVRNTGRHHVAVDDAEHQALAIIKAYQKLGRA